VASAVKLRWTRLAMSDLKSLHQYLSENNPAMADAAIDEVFTRIEILERHPYAGRKGRVHGTREFVLTGTPLVVCYRLHHDEIEILSVHHAAKRWPEHF